MPPRIITTAWAMFFVGGWAAPQGSKTAMARGGKAWLVEGTSPTGRARVDAWRTAVAAEGRRWAEVTGRAPSREPLAVELRFAMPRPASLPKRKYRFHTVKPDADKLTRAVLDALTAVVLHDDAQVVRLDVQKRYADLDEPPGCWVEVRELRVADDG